MIQDTGRKYRPFAITATTLGHPDKLYTPITVVNISKGNELVAATVNGMWDTGADICLMSRRLAEALLIDFDKTIPAAGILGDDKVKIGMTRVALLSNGETIDTYVAIVDSVSPTNKYSFVIGMDFIRKGALAISSTSLTTTLSFTIPSPDPIDFTSLYDLVEGKTKNLPLSVGDDEIRPVFGTSVMDLINPQ
ncbi:aspartyl protease family protein [uncultured Duncaniella sp.]|jgi:hypothetical protein|uniref:aspartyl protease family protein n=1 Tax=uncultured Duncaniella sp. TaxID=2768039 RepID=UPI0025B277BE|nr:aspartyl protease family protein [uncultured Duncaniella sp.]